jgi:CubicO group peptidase (beta-lactamase class C family)
MATGLDSTEHEEPGDDSTTNPERGWFQWAVTMGIFTGAQQSESPFSILKQMKRTKPGHTAFEYNSINTWILELIVEQVTGKPLSEVFGQAIWRNIGTQADGFIAITGDGYPMAWGFTSSTLRDLARFGMVYTPSWNKISKKQIISSKILNKIQHEGNPITFDKGLVGKQLLETFYETNLTNRYQWDVVFPDGDFYKEGVGGQGLYISPSKDLVIAWFSTGENPARAMARAVATSTIFTPSLKRLQRKL